MKGNHKGVLISGGVWKMEFNASNSMSPGLVKEKLYFRKMHQPMNGMYDYIIT